MTRLLLAALLLAPPARAACTHEQAEAKGEELSRVMQERMAAGPARTRALPEKLQAIGPADEQHAGFPDWTQVCGTYDAMMGEAR